ncbi:1507_t:CDS:2 [Paraglomus occultum]|uniref:1507_t:CDS:1 n=1 Tax=Paraglomus occultum TaxID=144539 RepID=A0A9N8WJN6_9GLOM|nr:1507_t:CDS:2 [Paraglomus occultum]
MTFGILGILATVLMVFLIASYMYLPSLHDSVTTKKILIPFALSVIVFSATDFFTVHQERTQLTSDVVVTIRYSTALFALGGAYALAGWSSLLFVHLHLLSVWRSTFITNHIIGFHIIIWAISLLAMILPVVTNNVSSGNTCFITPEKGAIYYIPMSFIYIAFILHVFTFGYITNVVLKAGGDGDKRHKTRGLTSNDNLKVDNSLKKVFRLQWRALVGVFLMLLIYVTAWVFYTFKNNVPNLGDPWFEEWVQCLETGTQTSCSSISAPHFPSFFLLVILLFTNRCVGIFIFLLLAAKKAIFYEWAEMLSNKIRGRRQPILP